MWTVRTVKMYIRKLVTNVRLVFFYALMVYSSSCKPHDIKRKCSWLGAISPATQPSYLDRSAGHVLGCRTHTTVLI